MASGGPIAAAAAAATRKADATASLRALCKSEGVTEPQINALVRAGADVNDASGGVTALMLLCANGAVTPALLVAMIGLDADVRPTAADGTTALRALCANRAVSEELLVPLVAVSDTAAVDSASAWALTHVVAAAGAAPGSSSPSSSPPPSSSSSPPRATITSMLNTACAIKADVEAGAQGAKRTARRRLYMYWVTVLATTALGLAALQSRSETVSPSVVALVVACVLIVAR
jgi:hypothetical protein